MLVLRLQKPHVLQADIAFVAASNHPIPVSLSDRKVMAVKEIYVTSILFTKLPLLSPVKASRAILDISAFERADLSSPIVIEENKVTIPIPPTHAVEIRQN